MSMCVLYLVKEPSLIEVYFGPQGFKFFADQLEQESVQVQFSSTVNEMGNNTWNENWLVVGVDTELGDPYIVVEESDDTSVYTAIFTGEIWELIPVALSFERFLICISMLQELAKQDEPAFVPNDSTITDLNQLRALEVSLSSSSECAEFWQQFINAYIDWLND